MTLMQNSESINFGLLNQYYELLGKSGLAESVSTLEHLMPDYYAELKQCAEQTDDTGFRRQAHKIKGACRSLGLARLGDIMQVLERDEWSWNDVEKMLAQWELWLEQDINAVKTWLEGKAE